MSIIKAILIDDELHALLYLELLLQEATDIQITGKFLSAETGLDHLRREQTDVVFLDIRLPEMNGLTVAKYIKQLDPHIQIVFVTAYAEYAVEAFELHALDYLLKPVSPLRLAITINRLRNSIPLRTGGSGQPVNFDPKIRCFKSFALSDPLNSDRKMKWRTAKTKELFSFLIHHLGTRIARDLILETLWPQFTPDKAMIHLHTSIYQIRKIIIQSGLQATLDFSMGSYRLHAEGLTTDVDLFESSLADMKAWDSMNESQWQKATLLLKLYAGHYFEQENYSWAHARRGRLLQQYLSLALHTADYELKHGLERQAVRTLNDALDKEPCSEEIAQLLMTGFAKLNDYKALQSFYEAFVKLLHNELDAEPLPQTQRHFKQLMSVVK